MAHITLQNLLDNKESIHVIGRTSYRTARIKDLMFECERDDFAFLEDKLSTKDNHVVLIFQILYNQYAGIYYAFLTDFYCLVGKEIVVEDF